MERCIKGGRHAVTADWSSLLDEELGGSALAGDEAEQRARQEKVEALKELAASRVSVLIGPAGTGITTRTIAQFLIKEDRYDPLTGNYRLSKQAPVQAGHTVVIDEASKLTEERLVAVLNAVTCVERLILVGYPRQLPPIGSGRPFVDIVAQLEPEYTEGRFPRVARGYAELTIRRRQTKEVREPA